MPWRTSSYHRYYYLDRKKLFFPTIALFCFFAMTLCISLWYFLDPTWYPKWPRRVRGKGAIWVYLFFAVVSLPVWLRVPIAFVAISEFITYRIAMLVWMFDDRPDFAIGPHGIYGIDYLKYRHISWRMIDYLEVKTYSSKLSSKTSSQITFVGKKWDDQNPDKMARVTAPKIVLRAYEGVSDEDILELMQKYQPTLTIHRLAIQN
jgi:hypothetical protein